MWEPIQYLTLDPGGTTGWAAWRPVTCKYNVGQLPPDKIWGMLEQAKHVYELEGPIIFESFHHRQGLPRADYTPVEVIGVVKEWARQNEWQIVTQTPSMKQYFTDDVLKKANLWTAGKPHAMDALRHLLYYRGAFTLVKEENEKRRQAYERNHY